ncbi:ATP-binding protein [Euzebya sp.]|uniref:sensor histidine kinase n=1 Tax=Euzebya sp. TaxID=1971409 RepID=UPI0035181B54
MQQTESAVRQEGTAASAVPSGELGPPDGDVSPQTTVAFRTWHRLLRLLLAVHVPLLLLFAVFREVELGTALLGVAVPTALVAAASAVGGPRVRAGLVAAGLASCSWLLVIWSGGAIEAHFHGLIAIGLVALYRDWIAVAIVATAQAALHLVVAQLAPDVVYNHPAAIESPAVWAFVHVVAVAGAVAIPIFSWRGSRAGEVQSASRASSEVREAAEAQRQRELASVYATVARRSQAMIERQLDVIEQLEAAEQDPETLQKLFALDHLATRMNREAGSMLVLAGGEPTRKVTGNPPLSEVVRAAVGEIEHFTRVDLQFDDDRRVESRLVPALIHLLSELIENAAEFSPPDSRVVVQGTTTDDGGYQMRIVDRGIGLDDARTAHYNQLLAHPPSTSPTESSRLGLDVVARLAGRHGIPVRLAHNAEGVGVTATLQVPAPLLGPADEEVLADAPPAELVDAPTPVAAAVLDPEPELTAPPSRWAAATAAGPAPAPAPAPEPVAVGAPPDPAEATRATTVPRVAASVSTGMSWSYSAHLRSQPARPAAAVAAPPPAGRGSRSQVTGPAPRQPDAPAAEPVAAADADHIERMLHGPAAGPAPAAGVATSAGRDRTPDPSSEEGSRPAPEDLRRTPPPPSRQPDTPPETPRRPAAATPAPETPAPETPVAETPAAEAPDPVTTRPDSPVADATVADAPVTDAQPSATRSGLPRRARGTSLPAGLRNPQDAQPASASAAPVSREESRSLLSSYQSRLQAGRKAAEDQVAQQGGAPRPAGTPTPERDDDR